MKRLPIRIIFALATFIIGITLTALWIFKKDIPEVEMPDKEIIQVCNFGIDSELPSSGRKFWEKEIFKRFREKPLFSSSNQTDKIYRLILLPTFDAPLIIRLEHKNNQYFFTTKKLSGQGGFGISKFGKLASEKTQIVTETEWKTFEILLNQSCFLDLPTTDKNEESVNDGAEWVMESLQNGHFHDVHRITPNENLEACYIYLLKLARVDKEYEGYLQGKYSS